MAYKIYDNVNGFRDATAEETTQIDKDKSEGTTKSQKKLIRIKNIRLQKLIETDYLALSDVVLSDAWKDKRKSWRDIPQDFTTEQYDSLLAKDSDGKLTHSVWSKP